MSFLLESKYLQVKNFLTAAEWSALLRFTVQQEAHFWATSTSTGEQDYRKSIVLYDFPEFSQLIQARIQGIFAEVLTRLEIPTFSIWAIEAQLTAHNDGHYYKIHNDSGSPDAANREVSYVYYFHREPKPFSGGELVLYDSQVEDGFYAQADSWKAIAPLNNSIVFFPSYCLHEVLPVSCPSRSFADSRFTINGWIRRSY